MLNIIYNISGLLMFVWYLGVRWNALKQYEWMYQPINLVTAFTSIIFLVPTLFLELKTLIEWKNIFYCFAIFLLYRNIYYAIEDIIDIPSNPKKQIFYVAIDLCMAIFAFCWLIKYYRTLL